MSCLRLAYLDLGLDFGLKCEALRPTMTWSNLRFLLTSGRDEMFMTKLLI